MAGRQPARLQPACSRPDCKTRGGRRGFLLLALLLAAATHSVAEPEALPPAASPDRYELTYRLDAEIRATTLRARLRAAGRLLMAGEAGGRGGGLALTLLHPLEPAWKLYWVDPVGPMGKEAKLAAVITLPEPTWEALEAARGRVRRLGERLYAQAFAEQARRHPLDGAFCFVVLGAPEGRFRVEVAPSGRLRRVENRLTHRWLSGDLDALLVAWAAARATGGAAPDGYWFWNHGESEPFAWEPHTYHAFAAALDLLSLPVFPDDSAGASARLGAGGVYTLPQDGLREGAAGAARRALETLAPKAAGHLEGDGGAPARFVVRRVTGGRLQVEGEARRPAVGRARDAPALTFHRLLSYDRHRRRPLSDAVRVSLEGPGGRLQIEVGYRSADEGVGAPAGDTIPPP